MFAQSLGTTTSLSEPHHEITVDAFGRATIEGKNFNGDVCGMLGEALRRAIDGSDSDSDEKKPEYYSANTQSQTQGW